MEISTLALYFICLGVWYLLLFIAAYLGTIHSSWYEKARTRSPTSTILKRIFKILAKPLFHGADLWSDIIIVVEIAFTVGMAREERTFLLGVLAHVLHSGMSSIITWMTSGERHRPVLLTVLQVFNLRVIYEVYVATKKGRDTYELAEIRMMEAIFESFPILVLMLYFFESDDTKWATDQWVLFGICVFLSIFTLSRILNYIDVYGLTPQARQSKFYIVILGLWRISEIIVRVFLWALFSTHISARGFFAYIFFSFIIIIALKYSYRMEYDSLSEAFISGVCNVYAFDIAREGNVVMAINALKLVECIFFYLYLALWNSKIFEWLETILFSSALFIYLCITFFLYWTEAYSLDLLRYAVAKNKDALFKSESYALITRLVLQRAFKELTPSQLNLLEGTGFDIRECRENRFTLEELHKLSFNLSHLGSAGYSVHELWDCKYFSISDFEEYGITFKMLKDEGVPIEEVAPPLFELWKHDNCRNAPWKILIQAGFCIKDVEWLTAKYMSKQLCHIDLMKLDIGRDVFETLATFETFPYYSKQDKLRSMVTPDHPLREMVRKIYNSGVDVEVALITLIVNECEAPLARLKHAGARAQGFYDLVREKKFKVEDFIEAGFTGTELFEADLFPYHQLADHLGVYDMMFHFESADMIKMETIRDKGLSVHQIEEARQIPMFLNQQYLKEIKTFQEMKRTMEETMPREVYSHISDTEDTIAFDVDDWDDYVGQEYMMDALFDAENSLGGGELKQEATQQTKRDPSNQLAPFEVETKAESSKPKMTAEMRKVADLASNQSLDI